MRLHKIALTPALSRFAGEGGQRERKREQKAERVNNRRAASAEPLRTITRKLVRRRTADRPDLRRIAHVKIDLAPKLQRAVEDGMRSDHDPRILVLAPRESVRPLDEQPAFDMRVRADFD